MSDDADEVTYSAVRSVFGSNRRDARWHLTDELDILTACGRATFDLRQVETTGGEVVEVTATCVLGSISFVVPRGTVVVLDGTSFLAAARSDVSADGSPDLPRIEITTTILGSVRVYSTDDELVAEVGPAEPTDEPAATRPDAETPAAVAPQSATEAVDTPAAVADPETGDVDVDEADAA